MNAVMLPVQVIAPFTFNMEVDPLNVRFDSPVIPLPPVEVKTLLFPPLLTSLPAVTEDPLSVFVRVNVLPLLVRLNPSLATIVISSFEPSVPDNLIFF